MSKEAVRIVVVGEVDHGKSTLIGRLLLETGSLSQEKREDIHKGMDLAFLTDQFKEERDEERTIDTTQVFFQAKKNRFCLIDTPGHMEFIKNMMTGATRADAALVVVDARSGLREQTKRHIALLGLLGIQQVIIVVNKMDLVAYRKEKFLALKNDTLVFLKKEGLIPRAIIPVSAELGDNIKDRSGYLKWFKGPTLLQGLGFYKVRNHRGMKPLRLPVQDVYQQGYERIIVGRIASGCVRAGQEIIAMPQGKRTWVIAIMGCAAKKRSAHEGENAGLILKNPRGLGRGAVICQPDKNPEPSTRFYGYVFWIGERQFGPETKLRFRCATQDVACIIKDGAACLGSFKEIKKATIKTCEPVIVEPFDFVEELGRFTLELNGQVCAVGIIA